MAAPNNLPHQLTSFIGREREIAEVKLLLGNARLVTLAGPGGSGKTRLSIESANALISVEEHDYPDGVWFVELAAQRDPALVPQAVASAFGLREQQDRTLAATLAEHL